jgi:type I restriction enzyme S subunit
MSDLYELPNGWEWKPLGEITNVIGGGTPKRNVKEYWDNGNIVWLSPTDLGNIGEIIDISDSKDKITQLGLDKSSAKLLPIGTVLYSSRATIGKIAINTIEVSTNQGFSNFVCNDDLYNKYLSFCLNRFTSDITSLSNSTTFKEVNKTNIKQFQIPLPPLSEQQRIVSKLDKLFEKIDKSIALHQLNMDEADIFMGSVLNDVFDIEKVSNWDAYQFDKISKFIDYRGKTPKKIDSGIQLITAKNVRFGYLLDDPKEYMSDISYDEWMVRGIPNKGDVLFTTEAPLGNVAILNTDEKRIFAQRIITFQPINDEVYQSNFLYYYMMSPYFRGNLFEKSTGTTVKGIKSSILKKFIIKIPSISIQQKVVKYLDEVSEKIEKVKSVQKVKMDSLIALKASILDRAFKGEL